MRHYRIVLFILGLVVSSPFARAGFLLDMDHAVYRADDSLSYVEIYVSVQRANLIYDEAGDSVRADFHVILEVTQDTLVVLRDTLSGSDVVGRQEQAAAGQFFPFVYRMIMKRGTYGVRASLWQKDPEPRDWIRDLVAVQPISPDSLRLSDVELGCELHRTDDISRFTKNRLHVVPNPTRFYGSRMPMFYYYLEAYGFDFDSTIADSYRVARRILDAESGERVRPDLERTYRKPGTTAVIADGFPATTLRTGTYYLELEVRCLRTGDTEQVRKKFWTYRPEDFAAGMQQPASPDLHSRLLEGEPDILEVLDPDSAFDLMHYVLDRASEKRLARLNKEGRREFLVQFWREREKGNPGAANQYFARVAEADRRYAYLKRPGWKTDRGRVFILYGEPDHITRNYAEAQIADHEIWSYERLEGGVIFVFLDKSGFGDLNLVHSTMRGEISNPNWNQTISSDRRGLDGQ